MPHALIVGGTGMLKGVPHYFTRHGFTVSVIARNPEGLNRLIESKSEHGFINPVKVDYSDYGLLEEKLRSAIDNYGEIESCVCWIHSTAPEALFILANVLNNQNISSKLFHVTGIENIQPDGKNNNFENRISEYKKIAYKKIILGFVIEDEVSRWLTDTEISNGVIDAVINEKEICTVGKTEPFNMRP